jgi:AAA+ superfamily predicted ATPase
LENRPRATELIYIMLAQRAARGLGGLYQHSGDMDFKQATEFASKWVPWGLLPADGGTIQHEEQFYIQQPGYGSSYVIGKIQLDELIAEYARQREGKFIWRNFMDDYERRGIIPMSLLYWEMTGDKSMVEKALR